MKEPYKYTFKYEDGSDTVVFTLDADITGPELVKQFAYFMTAATWHRRSIKQYFEQIAEEMDEEDADGL